MVLLPLFVFLSRVALFTKCSLLDHDTNALQSYTLQPNTGEYMSGGEFYGFQKVENNTLVMAERSFSRGCLRHFTFYLHIRAYRGKNGPSDYQDALNKYRLYVDIDGVRKVNQALVSWVTEFSEGRVDKYFNNSLCYSSSFKLSIGHSAYNRTNHLWSGLDCVKRYFTCPRNVKSYFTADFIGEVGMLAPIPLISNCTTHNRNFTTSGLLLSHRRV